MQIKIISHNQKNFDQMLNNLFRSNSESDVKLEKTVAEIIELVRKNGDQSIISLCNKFDKTNFKKPSELIVSKSEINKAKKNLDKKIITALELSYKRIYDYHQRQLPQDFTYQDELGNKLGNNWRVIEKIAIYVPGGTAIYPSSVLMNAVPALVAGCKDVVMATPSFQGKINEAVLMSAEICGIKTIYKVGGAAAIAGLALGTNTINKVNKIVGPGNNFVALAKKQLFGTVGIDMIAGPTDILVIADKDNNPDWVAADLLSQAEHGVDSKAILITDNATFANAVSNSISQFAQQFPRAKIVEESLKKSALVVVKNLNIDAPIIANQIAPEHLQIMTQKPNLILGKIKNAGAIFLGKYSPEAIGDYIAGPSHTLPTLGNAKFSSGLSVFDFLKRISVINCSQSGFKKLQQSAEILAEIEGFAAHKLSIEIRKD